MSNFCVVSLITKGESSVMKRYFEGLENGGPLFASHTSRKNDVYLHDETVTDVVQCLLGLPLLFCRFKLPLCLCN